MTSQVECPRTGCENCGACGKYIHLIHYDKAAEMDTMVLQAVSENKMNYNTVDRVASKSHLVSDYTLVFLYERCKIWLSLRMFLFHTIHFLKFLVKSRPRRCYKNGSYIEKKSVLHRERTNYRSQRHYSTQLQSKRNKSMQSCLTQNLALYSMAHSHAEATIAISNRAMGTGQHFRPS